MAVRINAFYRGPPLGGFSLPGTHGCLGPNINHSLTESADRLR